MKAFFRHHQTFKSSLQLGWEGSPIPLNSRIIAEMAFNRYKLTILVYLSVPNAELKFFNLFI